MLGMKTKTSMKTKRVKDAATKGAYRNFFHAAASISRAAKKSITRAKGPSPAGGPPHSRRGLMRRAIRFAAGKAYSTTRPGAVIGPLASVVGEAGSAHEFGGTYKGTEYPERSFMQPALREAIPRFAGDWRGSIGE